MALEDYFETEVGVAVAATAALFSPRVRGWLRKGAVYGVAGTLMAGDAITSFAKGVGRGAQEAAATAKQGAQAAPTSPTQAAKAPPGTRTRKAEDKNGATGPGGAVQ